MNVQTFCHEPFTYLKNNRYIWNRVTIYSITTIKTVFSRMKWRLHFWIWWVYATLCKWWIEQIREEGGYITSSCFHKPNRKRIKRWLGSFGGVNELTDLFFHDWIEIIQPNTVERCKNWMPAHLPYQIRFVSTSPIKKSDNSDVARAHIRRRTTLFSAFHIFRAFFEFSPVLAFQKIETASRTTAWQKPKARSCRFRTPLSAGRLGSLITSHYDVCIVRYSNDYTDSRTLLRSALFRYSLSVPHAGPAFQTLKNDRTIANTCAQFLYNGSSMTS